MSLTRRSRGLVAAVTLALLAAGLGSGPATASPAPGRGRPVTVSASEAAGLRAALDDLVRDGAVGAVVRVGDGSGSWSAAAGQRRLGGPRARARDAFRAASITKSMVATLVLQQVQRGHWRLGTRVRDVLPRLLGARGDITVGQLLSHRSGLPDYLAPLVAGVTSGPGLRRAVSRHRSDRRLVRTALALPAIGAPGETFRYANTNYVVLGMMLRRATHRPVGRLLARRVLRPAGMAHSWYARRPGIGGPHLSEYAGFGRRYALRRFDPSMFSSAGAVVSTAGDLERFYDALLTGRLLAPRLVRTMAAPRTLEPVAYGLGIYAVPDPCPAADGSPQVLLGHDGGAFGTLSISLSSPDARRQVTTAFTGRDFVTPGDGPAYDDVLLRGLLATCPNPPSDPALARERTLRRWRALGVDHRSTSTLLR